MKLRTSALVSRLTLAKSASLWDNNYKLHYCTEATRGSASIMPIASDSRAFQAKLNIIKVKNNTYGIKHKTKHSINRKHQRHLTTITHLSFLETLDPSLQFSSYFYT